MPHTNPTIRDQYPRDKALTEQSVPAVPAGATRYVLGLVSLIPAGLVALAIVFRTLDPARDDLLPGVVPLMGIYGLIGANLAVIIFAMLALKHPFLEPLQRLGWAVVIVTLAPVALPLFWYRHVLHPLRYASEETEGMRRIVAARRASHA